MLLCTTGSCKRSSAQSGGEVKKRKEMLRQTAACTDTGHAQGVAQRITTYNHPFTDCTLTQPLTQHATEPFLNLCDIKFHCFQVRCAQNVTHLIILFTSQMRQTSVTTPAPNQNGRINHVVAHPASRH